VLVGTVGWQARLRNCQSWRRRKLVILPFAIPPRYSDVQQSDVRPLGLSLPKASCYQRIDEIVHSREPSAMKFAKDDNVIVKIHFEGAIVLHPADHLRCEQKEENHEWYRILLQAIEPRWKRTRFVERNQTQQRFTTRDHPSNAQQLQRRENVGQKFRHGRRRVEISVNTAL
jgi:hypothetical protein